MAIRRRAPTKDREVMNGVPTRYDGGQTLIPRRITSVPRPTSSISQSAWDKFNGGATEWKSPSMFVASSNANVDVSSVDTTKKETAKDLAARETVRTWLAQPGYKRLWSEWLGIVRQPKTLTYAVEALWTKKHHSPVPDEMVLVVEKHFLKGKISARLLSVFPKTETAVQDLHKRYPGRAILSLNRPPQFHFEIVSPIAGPASAEILSASLQKRDVQVSHAVEKNVAIRVAGTKKVVTGDQVKLLWDVFLEYVHKNARSLVALCSDIQATLDRDAELLPSEFALTALRHGDNVHSIIPMTWEQADQLSDRYLTVYFKQLTITQYVPIRIRGSYAMDVVEEFFKGNGIFKNKIPPIERLLVAGTLTTGNVKEAKAQPWNDYLKYIKTLGHGLWNRMAVIYQATHYHELGEDEVMPHLWLLIDRDQIEGADYLQRIVVSDREGRASASAIQIAPTATGTRIVSLRGTGMLEVALAWLEGVGFKVQNVIEKGFVGGTFGFEIQWRHSQESPTWDGWRQYVQRLGLQGLGQRMRKIYEIVHSGEAAPDELVVLGRRIKMNGIAKFRNLRVLTVEEAAPYAHELNTMKLHLRRSPDGQETLVSASGTGAKEIIPLLTPQDGIVFAPDAGQMEDHARQLASYGSENFGNLDEQICKPEPLSTPADVMPVPQLIYPADMVELPREGGFQVTDPEAVKKFATPPSDKIPVLTAVSAMVMGVIALFYGGAALMRAPSANPAFGSGGGLLSPRERDGFNGT